MKALAILLLAAPAYAEVRDVPDNAGPIPDATLRVDAGLGMQFGVFEAGTSGDIYFGFEPTLAVRYDRLSLVARGSLATLDKPGGGKYAPADGSLLRGGGDVRFAVWQDRVLATSKHGKPVQWVRGEVWLGAGANRERIDWYRGATTNRTDVALELGATSWIRFGPDHGAHAAFTAMLELDFARPPPDRVDPVHSAFDHSVLITFALAFGN